MKPETVDYLIKLHTNRKQWEVKPGGVSTMYKPNEVILRLLSIRTLEIAVRDSVNAAIAANVIPEELVEAYSTFLADEDKHYDQLNYLATHCNYSYYEDKYTARASAFHDRFNKLLASGEHPIMLNFLLETVVFITGLPLLQAFGDSYSNYVASWILLDEARHVAYGRNLMNALGVSISKEALNLAFDVLKYVVEPLPPKEQEKRLHNAVKTLRSGVDVEDTVNLVVPPRTSFFEQSYESLHY